MKKQLHKAATAVTTIIIIIITIYMTSIIIINARVNDAGHGWQALRRRRLSREVQNGANDTI